MPPNLVGMDALFAILTAAVVFSLMVLTTMAVDWLTKRDR